MISVDAGSQAQPESEEAQENPSIGDWYTVEYEGRMYPGEVIAVGHENDYQVSVMEQAGKYWKWPNPRDVIFYLREKMSKKLDAPLQLLLIIADTIHRHILISCIVQLTWHGEYQERRA